jgi:hypothetical protein
VRNEPSLAAAVLRRRVDAVGSGRLDLAAVVELLGQAEITLGTSDTGPGAHTRSSSSATPRTAI